MPAEGGFEIVVVCCRSLEVWGRHVAKVVVGEVRLGGERGLDSGRRCGCWLAVVHKVKVRGGEIMVELVEDIVRYVGIGGEVVA